MADAHPTRAAIEASQLASLRALLAVLPSNPFQTRRLDGAGVGPDIASLAEFKRLHREIGGAALRFADVAARCDEQLLYDDSERWRLLARAQDANPLAPDEEASLQEVRDFVRVTAQRYRMLAPLEVTVEERRVSEDPAGLATLLSIERVDPQPGFEVDTAAFEAELRHNLLTDGPRAIEAPAERVDPETTVEAVDRVLADAERALSAPIALTRGESRLVLDPDDLAALLAVERRNPDLALVADAGRVDALVATDLRAQLETEPVDASFEIAGDTVQIIPSTDGFRFDPESAAEQIIQVATGDGDREAELDGEFVEPELTTADAEALGIVERVSSFTTHFQAGQSRVTNIQRIAQLIDGVVIEPGDTFSVNGHVGPRTRDKGFVAGGAIEAGEFVSAIGGGVSQFATTMYNAAYFGGYAIPEFKPHSYYISRYPAGREATLNYPDIDLKVHNTSPHGILVQTSYTSTSVTVAFWGTKWVEVESVEGPRRNVRQPPTRVNENPALAEGTERVVQSGRAGFDITVTRVLRFPDGREEREPVNTRYVAEPRIVERGTKPPEPPADETEDDDDADEDEDEDEDDDDRDEDDRDGDGGNGGGNGG